MTQYEKVLERYPSGMVTLSKPIKQFCPSDLLENGIDDCDGEKEELKCEKCWIKKLGETK